MDNHEEINDFVNKNFSKNEILQIKWLLEVFNRKHPNNTFTLTDLYKSLNTKKI